MQAVRVLTSMQGPGVSIDPGQILVVGEGCSADEAARLVAGGLAEPADPDPARAASLVPVPAPEAPAPPPRKRVGKKADEDDDEPETAEDPQPQVQHAALRTKKPSGRKPRGK